MARASPPTGSSVSSQESQAQRFRREFDELKESYAVANAAAVKATLSLSFEFKPPGIGRETATIASQTDVHIGTSTWVVTLQSGQDHRQAFEAPADCDEPPTNEFRKPEPRVNRFGGDIPGLEIEEDDTEFEHIGDEDDDDDDDDD